MRILGDLLGELADDLLLGLILVQEQLHVAAAVPVSPAPAGCCLHQALRLRSGLLRSYPQSALCDAPAPSRSLSWAAARVCTGHPLLLLGCLQCLVQDLPLLLCGKGEEQ